MEEMGSVLGFCPVHMASAPAATSHYLAPFQKDLKHPSLWCAALQLGKAAAETTLCRSLFFSLPLNEDSSS